MPVWPGAVATRRSFAWQDVQLVQPSRGWPIGGTGTLPTPLCVGLGEAAEIAMKEMDAQKQPQRLSFCWRSISASWGS